MEWADDPEGLEALAAGADRLPRRRRGAMREMNATGYMHNRARMIVASFLTKDLHLDWRHGERWFMRQLLDGDLASNNGGWQWTASTGTDPAPYFRRMFNPMLQQKKFDPHGRYVRRWCPELAGVPDARLIEPWRMSAEEQAAAGCIIGVDYPAADRRPMPSSVAMRRPATSRCSACLRTARHPHRASVSVRDCVHPRAGLPRCRHCRWFRCAGGSAPRAAACGGGRCRSSLAPVSRPAPLNRPERLSERLPAGADADHARQQPRGRAGQRADRARRAVPQPL